MLKASHRQPLFGSAEALFELERELAEPLFQGVPIGSTLGDIFSIVLYNLPGYWDFKSINLDRLRYYYHYLFGLRFAPEPMPTGQGKILFTWLLERPHFREMVLPLLNAFGSVTCNVIGRSPSMAAHLPPDTGFLSLFGVPRIDLGAWRREYKRCAPVWHRKLKAVLRRQGISEIILPHLISAMLAQSQKVMAYGQLLDRLKPSAVVTEFDRNSHASCLILAANARRIPTMTMIHGVINPPYGYTPLLADLAFCWGEQHRQQLIALGTPPERLVITGCQRLRRSLEVPSETAKEKLGFPPDKPLALLATNLILPESRRRLAQIFCEGVAANSQISGAVRLHPSEILDFYAQEIAAYPDIRFLANNEWTVEEALSAADVIVCHNSGFGNDALTKGKFVIILDVLPIPLSGGKELVEKAGCPVAHNATDLYNILDRILSDHLYATGLRQCADSFVERFCSAFGSDAIDNIYNIITTIIKGEKSFKMELI